MPSNLNSYYLWIVEGLTDSADNLYVYSSRSAPSAVITNISTALSSAGVTEVVALVEVSDVSPARLRPLDPLSSDSGYAVVLSRLTGSEPLLADGGAPFRASGSTYADVTRLAAYVDDDDTSITLTSANGVALNTYVHLNDETVKITNTGSAPTYTVTRGTQGTSATWHPVGVQAPVAFQSLPAVEGARCTLYRGDYDNDSTLADLEVLHRGVIQTVDDRGDSTLAVQVGSIWERIKTVKFRAPQGNPMGGNAFITANQSGSVAPTVYHLNAFWVDEELHGSSTWSKVWAEVEGDFVLMDVEQASGGQPGGIRIYRTTGQERPRIASNDRVDIYNEFRMSGDATDRVKAVDSIRYALFFDSTTPYNRPSQIVEALLSGDAVDTTLQDIPRGMHLGLRSDEYDAASLTKIDDAWPLDALFTYHFAGFVLPPFEGSILQWIADEILAPLGLGVTVGQGAKLTVIDFAPRQTSADYAIEDSDLSSASYSRTRDSGGVLRSVVMTEQRGSIDTLQEAIESGVASAYHGGAGRNLSFDLGAYNGYARELKDRWIGTLFPAYDRARYLLAIRVQPGVATGGTQAKAGDFVSLSLDHVPGADGSQGIAQLGALVLSASESATDRTQRLELVTFEGVGIGATWTPTGTVAAGDAGTGTSVTIEANTWTSSVRTPSTDAEAFATYDNAFTALACHLWLLDTYGTRRDDNAPTLTGVSGNVLTLGSVFSNGGVEVTRNAGDIVVLADYDTQPSSIQNQTVGSAGFGAGTDAELGAAGDDGRLYS